MIFFSIFRYLTGENFTSFGNMVADVGNQVADAYRNFRVRDRQPCLTTRNMILMTIIWLRRYPTYHTLGGIFQVSATRAWRVVRVTLPRLYIKYTQYIKWPQPQQWIHWQNSFHDFPTGVGAIDGTYHPISRPHARIQRRYYSGHKKLHCLHTQFVVTPDGKIVFCKSG